MVDMIYLVNVDLVDTRRTYHLLTMVYNGLLIFFEMLNHGVSTRFNDGQ